MSWNYKCLDCRTLPHNNWNVSYLDDTNSEPLTPPKVDIATDIGMIHAITPNKLLPNVC